MAVKKKAQMPQPYEPVLVVWEDAASKGDADHHSVDLALQSYKPCIRKSVAIYVGIAESNGRKALMIATEDDRCEDSPEAIGGVNQIPIGMVISCTPIRRRRSCS